uniref:MULE transposase domain-containing protein n=1 Tax=Cyprinus carpio carpio TaxID=630221 RepID=A0A9J8CVZ0_CYPCA
VVDKDMCEINALRKVFPESDILLCWYHVMLSKTDSGISGPSNTDVRTEIISFIRKMKLCATLQDFKSTAEQFLKRFEDFPALCSYFKDHWLEIGHTGSDFGWCYNHQRSFTPFCALTQKR